MRLAVRIIPLLLFVYNIKCLLQAMRCQTSPHYLSYQNASATSGNELGSDGGIFYQFGSTLLFWEDDLSSCQAVNMAPTPNDAQGEIDQAMVRGSLSMLWPLFQSLCLSQFVETLLCTIQGQQVMAETGMTIFEHSLAFAEAEAAVASRHGWGLFSLPELSSDDASSTGPGSSFSMFASSKRSALLTRLNTTPETLLVGLISSCSHLTSQVLGIFGLQGRYRLYSTGFWGLAFMSILLWSSLTFHNGKSDTIDLLRFPTVCIVGFVPHLLVLIGIAICAMIYFLAILLSALSLSAAVGPGRTFKQRLRLAMDNLQVNMQLSSIRVSKSEDFYSALLKVGFVALTAASEAVFLNEGNPVGVRRWTWLEEERLQEVESTRAARHRIKSRLVEGLYDGESGSIAEGLGLVDEAHNGNRKQKRLYGGYAREKGLRKLTLGDAGAARLAGDGVGAATRTGRWIMVSEFFKGICLLTIRWHAIALVKILDRLGMARKPRWLLRFVSRETVDASKDAPACTIRT